MHRNVGYTALIPKSWLAQNSLSGNVSQAVVVACISQDVNLENT